MLLAIKCCVARGDILNEKENITFSVAKPSWNAEATSESNELLINRDVCVTF
jgi:hypothetical protein